MRGTMKVQEVRPRCSDNEYGGNVGDLGRCEREPCPASS